MLVMGLISMGFLAKLTNHKWGICSFMSRAFLLSEGDFRPGQVPRQEYSFIWGRPELDKRFVHCWESIEQPRGTQGTGLSRSWVPEKCDPQPLFPGGQPSFQKNLEENRLQRSECNLERMICTLPKLTPWTKPERKYPLKVTGGSGLEMNLGSNHTCE